MFGAAPSSSEFSLPVAGSRFCHRNSLFVTRATVQAAIPGRKEIPGESLRKQPSPRALSCRSPKAVRERRGSKRYNHRRRP